MNISRSKRPTTTEQYRDAVKDLDDCLYEISGQVVRPLAHAFMEYWDSNDAAAAMNYLKYVETRTRLRMLQRVRTFWKYRIGLSTFQESLSRIIDKWVHPWSTMNMDYIA